MGTRELELHCQVQCVVEGDFYQEVETQQEKSNLSEFLYRNQKGKYFMKSEG